MTAAFFGLLGLVVLRDALAAMLAARGHLVFQLRKRPEPRQRTETPS